MTKTTVDSDRLPPILECILKRSAVCSPARHAASEIEIRTVKVPMRDGVRLATDLYLPPVLPAPTIVVRTPYDRSADALAGVCLFFARRGFAVAPQDCRGTGASEPDSWDYYVREAEDGPDFVQWVTEQPWCEGFIGALGGSYVGQTQWSMALHPAMSAIVPEVSGLGGAVNTAHLHMFCNAYAKTVGKGAGKFDLHYTELEAHILDETLATGFFNAPLLPELPPALRAHFPNLAEIPVAEAQARLWEHYCRLGCADRASFLKAIMGVEAITIVEIEKLSDLFGVAISHDRHSLPHPDLAVLAASLQAPALIRTGWYDWGLNDAFDSWQLLMNSAADPVRAASRLFIGPSAHNMPGYHEGMDRHPELHHAYGVVTNFELLRFWFETVRDDACDKWPRVIYYLMGANQWRTAADWPPPNAKPVRLYLASEGRLCSSVQNAKDIPDRYIYDPLDATPTVGGSIVSYVYPPGSVDIAEVQSRSDVVVYTTEPLSADLDVVGPLRLRLHASSSAVDTDFVGRLSDVFPDGRAIQLQNGLLRARYRDLAAGPQLLEPGKPYVFEIDMWATANRFRAGHRLRLDISSADFPRLDRNANLGGVPGEPVRAEQTIYHDPERPSYLEIHVLGDGERLLDFVSKDCPSC